MVTGVPLRAQQIILQSWRQGTSKQYKVYLNKWAHFAQGNARSALSPVVADVLEFMSHLYDSGLGYSGLNTCRAALSSAVVLQDSHWTVGNHPMLIRFLKGVFQTRPALPRYHATRDVGIVLQYLKGLAPATDITLKALSMKVVMLCLLITGHRGQTIHLLDLCDMRKGKSSYTFTVTKPVKQCRPGKAPPEIRLVAYPAGRRLCIVTYLSEYL